MKKIFIFLTSVSLILNLCTPFIHYSLAQDATPSATLSPTATNTPTATPPVSPTATSTPTTAPSLSPALTSTPTPTPTQTLPSIFPTISSLISPSPTSSPSATPILVPDLPSLTTSPSQFSATIRPKVIVRRLSKKQFQANEPVTVDLENSKGTSLKTSVIDKDGKKLAVRFETIHFSDKSVLIVSPPAQFRPGKYKLIITDWAGNTTEQDFIWGVLALNTNKSIYIPKEKASMSMAVLDEAGNMVCDAKVKLAITKPDKSVDELTTNNNKITANPECSLKMLVSKPDYEAMYDVDGVGIYKMELTAETKNGSYTIDDSFEVRQSVDFDVERVTATRIYPPVNYPVTFNITANKDFEGTVIEEVPADFAISPNNDVDVKSFNTTNTSEKVNNIRFPFEGQYPVTLGFGEDSDQDIVENQILRSGLKGHDGVDFAMPESTPILAVDDGEVVPIADNAEKYGITIVIQHSWGKSYYGHLSKVLVSEGKKVSKGEKIGLSGDTGFSTGPHLHFTVKPENFDAKNGYYGKVDPLSYLGVGNNGKTLGVKYVRWNITIKKGEKITLGYNFKAPNISPQFYLLGPLRFIDTENKTIFQEARQWQIAADAFSVKGMAAYQLSAQTATPKIKSWTGSAWNAAQNANTVTGTVQWVVTKANPQRDEIIIGTLDASNDIKVQICTKAGSCGTVKTMTATASTNATRVFDIEIEKSSGDVLVVYETGTNQQISFDRWNGTAWAGASTLTIGTASTLNSYRLDLYGAYDSTSPNPDNMMLCVETAVTSTYPDLYCVPWTGSTNSFGTVQQISLTLEPVTSQGFYGAYEDISGDFIVFFSKQDVAILQYYTYVTTTWTLGTGRTSAAAAIFGFRAAVYPDTNRIMACWLVDTTSDDLDCQEWSGTAIQTGVSVDAAIEAISHPTRHMDVAPVLGTSGFLVMDPVSNQNYYSFRQCTSQANCQAGTWSQRTPDTTDIGTDTRWGSMYADPAGTGDIIWLGMSQTVANGWYKGRITCTASGCTTVEAANTLGAVTSLSFESAMFDFITYVTPTFNQAAYRWFENNNGTSVVTPLANQDIAASAPTQGTGFRLRTLLDVSTIALGATAQSFELQYAVKSGTCDTDFVGESYSDVSPSSGTIRFNDNGTPADGDTVTANGTYDPTYSGHTKVMERYEENNPTNNVAAIPSGQAGLWDFSLVDYSASAGTSYCFRTKKDNSSYTVNPQTTKDVSSLGTTGSLNYGTWDGTNYWIGNFNDHTLHKISPAGTILNTYALDSTINPLELAWDGTYIWVASADQYGRLVKFDPASGSVVNTWQKNPTGNGLGGVQGVMYDGTNLWIGVAQQGWVDATSGFVAKLDPADPSTNICSATGITDVNGLTHSGSYVWAAANTSGNFVAKIAKSDCSKTTYATTTNPVRVDNDGTYVYIAHWNNGSTGKVYKKLMSDGSTVGIYDTCVAANSIRLDSDKTHFWTACDDGQITVHNASDGTVLANFTPGTAGDNMNGLTFDGSYMWAANWQTSHVYKMNTGEMLNTYTKIPEIQTIGLGNSTSANSTANSFQRKTWYDGTRYWQAYNSGSGIEFYYSTDGATWRQNFSAAISVATNDFSIEADSTNAFITYTDGGNTEAIKALSYPGTAFSWDTATTVFTGGATGTFGKTAVGGTLWTPGVNKWMGKFTLSADSTVTNLKFYGEWDGTGLTNNKGFIYSDNAGTPNILKGTTNVTSVNSTTAQWWTLTFPSPVSLTAGTYWLGILMEEAGTYVYYDSGGTSAYDPDNETYSTGPTDPCASVTQEGNALSIYATLSGEEYDYPAISKDSNNKLWITATSYDASNYLFKAIQSTTANVITAWGSATTLDTSTNSNKYGIIVPQSSGGNMYAVWTDGTTIEGKKYTGTWEGSPTTIGNGTTGITNNMSAVTDTTNYYIHLLYIDSSDYTVYQKYTTDWQTAVPLDSTAGNGYPTISIDTAGSNGLYAFWTRNNYIYYRRGCSPYTFWDSAATLVSTGTNTWTTAGYKDFASGKIFVEWTQGSASPYTPQWNSITPTTCGGAAAGPTLNQLLRHGGWFNDSGVRQPMTF